MIASLSYKERIERSKDIVRKFYYKASVIDKIVAVRDAQKAEENFLKLYKRVYIPKEWFTREDIYTDLVFEQFGSNIAFSEKKYILNEILKNENIQRLTSERIDLDVLRKTLLSISKDVRPTVIFMPIAFFTKLHIDWCRNGGHLKVYSFDKISIDKRSFRIFWSNKYIPFDEFVFIDKNFGEWVSKPNFKERLFVDISESDKPDQLDLLIYTTFKFRILDPSRITILEISK